MRFIKNSFNKSNIGLNKRQEKNRSSEEEGGVEGVAVGSWKLEQGGKLQILCISFTLSISLLQCR